MPFRDLLTKAESQEQFLTSLQPPSPAPVAFTANRSSGYNQIRSQNSSSSSRGQSTQPPAKGNRRPSHCQLCRTNGHYANKCPKLASFATSASSNEDIARVFHSKCNVHDDAPDRIADSRADLHMTDDTGSENKQTAH